MDVYTSQTIRLTIIFNEKSYGFLAILENLLDMIYFAGPTDNAPRLAMPLRHLVASSTAIMLCLNHNERSVMFRFAADEANSAIQASSISVTSS